MTIALFIGGWILVSIPFGFIVGKACAVGSGEYVAA